MDSDNLALAERIVSANYVAQGRQASCGVGRSCFSIQGIFMK